MVTSIAARWQKPGRSKPIRLIVIHCTVSPEQGSGAEQVARYFASVDRPASTHLVSDNNSTVRCVADGDTAYGAAGANHDGLHIELVGYPQQSRAEWLDAYSRDELEEAGPHIAAWSVAYGVPLRWLSVAQVADGQTKGLCTHHDVSQAFPDVSTGHWDPGPGFPKDEALRIWNPEPLEDDDLTPEQASQLNAVLMLATSVSDRLAEVEKHLEHLDPYRPELLDGNGDKSATGVPASKTIRWESEAVRRLRAAHIGDDYSA